MNESENIKTVLLGLSALIAGALFGFRTAGVYTFEIGDNFAFTICVVTFFIFLGIYLTKPKRSRKE